MLSQYPNTLPQWLWTLRKIKMTQEPYFDYRNPFNAVLKTRKNSEICQNQHAKVRTHQTHSNGFLLRKNKRMGWRGWEEMHEDDNNVLRKENSLPRLLGLIENGDGGWKDLEDGNLEGLEVWKSLRNQKLRRFRKFESVKASIEKKGSFL